MALKGMKRPAASQAAGSSPKSPKGGRAPPTKAKCNSVKAALLEAEGNPLPAAVRTLLANAVQDSLGVMKDERHACQVSAVEMIGQALKDLETAKHKAVQEVEGKIAGANKVAATRAEEKTSAEKIVSETMEPALEHAKATLDSDVNAVKAAAEAVKDAKVAQRDGDAAAKEAAATKDSLEKVQAQVTELRNQETGCNQKTIHEILSAGKHCGFDATLLGMLPESLKKGKDERSTFDSMAVDHLEAEVKKNLAKIIEEIADPVAAKASRDSAVEAAVAAQDAATKKKEESVKAVADAHSTLKEGKTALTSAIHNVAAFEKEIKGHAKELEEGKRNLASFQEGALAAFKELEILAPPPPPPAEPVPESAPPAAEDATVAVAS